MIGMFKRDRLVSASGHEVPLAPAPRRRIARGAAVARAGFTLLEIILATSLSAVLLAALYAVLKLHLTYSQKAPAHVQKTLLARAIVDRMAHDIRAVVPPAASPASAGGSPSSGSETGGSGTGSSSTDEAALGTTADPYRASYGVLGGTDWLQLYIAPSFGNLDDLELAAAGGAVAQTSSVMRVTYALTVMSTRPDAKGRTQRLVLTRSEVASVGAEQLDAAADDADIKATTTYLSDELADVQFQYWDDVSSAWVDSWGVDVPIAPPRAIKVFVSLQDPDEYLQTELGLAGTQSTWDPAFQLVIPIATWSPEAESTSVTGESM